MKDPAFDLVDQVAVSCIAGQPCLTGDLIVLGTTYQQLRAEVDRNEKELVNFLEAIGAENLELARSKFERILARSGNDQLPNLEARG